MTGEKLAKKTADTLHAHLYQIWPDVKFILILNNLTTPHLFCITVHYSDGPHWNEVNKIVEQYVCPTKGIEKYFVYETFSYDIFVKAVQMALIYFEEHGIYIQPESIIVSREKYYFDNGGSFTIQTDDKDLRWTVGGKIKQIAIDLVALKRKQSGKC